MRWRSSDIEGLVSRLEAVYGRPRFISRFDPLEELVSCILSQHTTDAKSFPAFTRLRATFETWQDVVDAGPERVADTVRTAGLANQKARNIVRCLQEIHQRNGAYTLEPLRGMPMLDARAWLQSLPGVGPKTASIVLCFSFGMGAIPVDTHVYRVAWRLGMIPETLGEAKAHDALLRLVAPDLAFRFHTSLIQHGRLTCRAPLPLCEECAVPDLCRWKQKGGPEKRHKELQRRRGAKKRA
ncbi:MAG: endonuclease III [Chthonomonadaceae bacterium]|nr:endonuclease III [Chthonomonadaceae bacterium]